MKKRFRMLSVIMAFVFFISGCSTLSTVSSTQPDVSIRIMDKPSAPAPVKEELPITTFGSYHFVVEKAGSEPLYGVLPLHVNPVNIVLGALFFAPSILFTARSAYPFYEIDSEKKLIRYSEDGVGWYDYSIQPEEVGFAQIYYKDLSKEQNKIPAK